MSYRVRSVTLGYYVAITLLLAGLGVAVALLTGVAGPSREGIRIGAAVPLACNPGDGSPSCFDFTIRNASSAAQSVECLVVPAEHTVASFVGDADDDRSSIVLTLAPNEELTVHTSVDTEADGVIAAPHVECEPVTS